jgi:hypothetical protein
MVDALSSDVATPLVLSETDPSGTYRDEGWNPADRYVGQDFVTRTWWEPAQLYTNDQLSWWLYRTSVSKPTPVQRVVLWMQAQDQGSSQ